MKFYSRRSRVGGRSRTICTSCCVDKRRIDRVEDASWQTVRLFTTRVLPKTPDRPSRCATRRDRHTTTPTDDVRDDEIPDVVDARVLRTAPRSPAGWITKRARARARAIDARGSRIDDLRCVDPAGCGRGGGAFGAENGGAEVF